MSLTVVRVGKKWDPGAVDVTRGHSPLGNPFRLIDSTDIVERDEVCDQYDAWLKERVLARDPAVIGELKRLLALARQGDLLLGCYCAPRRCHADTIKRYLDGALNGI